MDKIDMVIRGLFVFGFLGGAALLSAAAYFFIPPYRKWFERTSDPSERNK